MSFFFNKSEGKDNLQYDDTAFLHFAISLCIVNTAIFLCLVKRDISSFYKPGLKQLKKMNIYKEKIQNYDKIKKQYFSSWPFIVKIMIIILSMSIAYECFNNVDTNQKMIGFDPYQILGVQYEAPLIKIKKAYRKLALEYHPDRNVNNPQAAAKFIQISKAYECLTDEQAKQKCEKYGNPDGEASFKVGIGLPKVIISADNQYLVLPAVFLILLVVVPRTFLAWNSKIKTKDESGMEIGNYWNIFKCFNPKMNTISCTWAMSCMKELDQIFPPHSLSENQAEAIKNLLIQTGSVEKQNVQKIPSHILHRTLTFYQYLSNQSKDPIISQFFPELAIKLTYFSSYFGKRMLEGKALYQNPEWIVRWCGLLPLRCMVDFTRQLFNQDLRLADVSSIQFLDLTEQEMSIAKKNVIPNLQSDLLHSEEKITTFVDKFPQQNREYIKKQIKCLPALSITVRTLLGDEEVNELTVDDFPIFEVKVKKHNKSFGYVTTKNHNFLHNEHFYIIFSHASNLLHLSSFSFEENSQEQIFRFPFRSQEPREWVFQIRLVSYCYLSNMDIAIEHKTAFVDRRQVIDEDIQNDKVNFHKEDLQIENMPKDFWESLVSMDLENDSDKELSDGEDSQESEDEKNRWEQQKKQ